LVDDSYLDLRCNHCGVLNRCSAPSSIFAADRVEVSVMEEHVPTRNNDPQLDEAVWQAWVRKNEIRDRVSLARRKKSLALVLILGIAAILWRIIRLP
jgi:hypothetical protein